MNAIPAPSRTADSLLRVTLMLSLGFGLMIAAAAMTFVPTLLLPAIGVVLTTYLIYVAIFHVRLGWLLVTMYGVLFLMLSLLTGYSTLDFHRVNLVLYGSAPTIVLVSVVSAANYIRQTIMISRELKKLSNR